MTQQLIPVFNGEIDGIPQQLCDARDLHTFLEISSIFSNWIHRRIAHYGFVEGEDFFPFLEKSSGGRPGTGFHLTLDMAKELAMVEKTEKGRQVRRYFIAMERQVHESRGATYLSLNQQLAIHRQVPKLLSQLKAETTPAIRATLHAQLAQHCHLLAIPVPPIHNVGRAAPENGELFPLAKG